MKWLVIVLAVTVGQACDAPWAGPALPAGGHWVNYVTLSFEGPPVHRGGIVAAKSIAELKAKVVSLELSGRPGATADRICPTQPETCWPRQAEQPGLLYLAVPSSGGRCDVDVKEAAAIAARTLYFIEWTSGPNGSRCDAGLGPPRWGLLSVSRRDLPGAGTLTLRLQLQSSNSDSTAAESQLE